MTKVAGAQGLIDLFHPLSKDSYDALLNIYIKELEIKIKKLESEYEQCAYDLEQTRMELNWIQSR